MKCHALDRARERYNLHLCMADLQQIVADIQDNKGTLLKIMPDKTSAWLIEVQGKLCKLVMSAPPELDRIITFLPFSAYAVLDEKGRPKTKGHSRKYIERKRDHRHGSHV